MKGERRWIGLGTEVTVTQETLREDWDLGRWGEEISVSQVVG